MTHSTVCGGSVLTPPVECRCVDASRDGSRMVWWRSAVNSAFKVTSLMSRRTVWGSNPTATASSASVAATQSVAALDQRLDPASRFIVCQYIDDRCAEDLRDELREALSTNRAALYRSGRWPERYPSPIGYRPRSDRGQLRDLPRGATHEISATEQHAICGSVANRACHRRFEGAQASICGGASDAAPGFKTPATAEPRVMSALASATTVRAAEAILSRTAPTRRAALGRPACRRLMDSAVRAPTSRSTMSRRSASPSTVRSSNSCVMDLTSSSRYRRSCSSYVSSSSPSRSTTSFNNERRSRRRASVTGADADPSVIKSSRPRSCATAVLTSGRWLCCVQC